MFSSQNQGGITRYFSELIKGLEILGVETLLPLRFTSNQHLVHAFPDRFRTLWPGFDFRGKNRIIQVLNRGPAKKAVKANGWDLFHPTYYDTYALSHLRNRPLVVTLHDMIHELHPEGLSNLDQTQRFKIEMAARADALLAVSANTKKDAVKILGLREDKIHVVPHGNSLNPETLKSRLPSFESPYWLYVGTRGGYKNWSLLVLALGRLERSEHLVMVGGGNLNSEEKELLETAGMKDRYLQIACSEEELAGWYSKARALVYTSRSEGFGMPLIEAMAWGCPVVAANASCLPEVGGNAALYFDPASPDDLIRALTEVADPGVRQRLVGAGYERQKLFTWAKTAQSTLAVYKNVCEGSGGSLYDS